MSLTEKNGRLAFNLSVAEIIAGIALLVTVVSGLNGWIVLPERQSQLERKQTELVAANLAQDIRMRGIEEYAQQRSEILARIDERTKRIEELLKLSK